MHRAGYAAGCSGERVMCIHLAVMGKGGGRWVAEIRKREQQQLDSWVKPHTK